MSVGRQPVMFNIHVIRGVCNGGAGSVYFLRVGGWGECVQGEVMLNNRESRSAYGGKEGGQRGEGLVGARELSAPPPHRRLPPSLHTRESTMHL